MSTHDAISGFMLERYALGELDGEELRAAEAAVSADPALALRVDAIRAGRVTFLKHAPYASFRIEHEKRMRARPRWLTWGVMSLVTAAAVVFVMVRPVDYSGIKGSGVGLTAMLVGNGVPKALASGARVRPGDRVQLAYDAGELAYVALLGIDGSGAVTVYFPEGAQVMAQRGGAARATFPFSLTLDNTPGNETMVAVFADKPLALSELASAVNNGGTVAGARMARIVLTKEP